jgi:hypothetical protein
MRFRSSLAFGPVFDVHVAIFLGVLNFSVGLTIAGRLGEIRRRLVRIAAREGRLIRGIRMSTRLRSCAHVLLLDAVEVGANPHATPTGEGVSRMNTRSGGGIVLLPEVIGDDSAKDI